MGKSNFEFSFIVRNTTSQTYSDKPSDLSQSSYHIPNSAKWLQKIIPLVVHRFTKLTRNKYRNHFLIKLFPGENDRSDINSSWVPLWSFKSESGQSRTYSVSISDLNAHSWLAFAIPVNVFIILPVIPWPFKSDCDVFDFMTLISLLLLFLSLVQLQNCTGPYLPNLIQVFMIPSNQEYLNHNHLLTCLPNSCFWPLKLIPRQLSFSNRVAVTPAQNLQWIPSAYQKREQTP